jgi:hypothetical protein
MTHSSVFKTCGLLDSYNTMTSTSNLQLIPHVTELLLLMIISRYYYILNKVLVAIIAFFSYFSIDFQVAHEIKHYF